MTCSEIEVLLSTRRDLSRAQEHALQQHLSGCSSCAAAWREEQRTTSLLQSLKTPAYVSAPRRAVLLDAPRRRLGWPRMATALVGLLIVLALGMQLLPPSTPGGAAPPLSANPGGPTPIPPPGEVLVGASAPGGNLRESTLTAYSPQADQVLYSLPGDDALLTWDGRTLYVASLDSIAAVDSLTGQERWRTPIEHRMEYIGGSGPSALGISPDGRWLFVISYDSGDSQVPFWLQVLDTQSGALQPETISLPDCAAPELGSSGPNVQPLSEHIYVICTDAILSVDWANRQLDQTVALEALSPDVGLVQDALAIPGSAGIGLLTKEQALRIFETYNQDLSDPIAISEEDPAPYAGHIDYLWQKDLVVVLQLLPDEQGQPSEALLALYSPAYEAEQPLTLLPIEQPLRRAGMGFSNDESIIYVAGQAGLLAVEPWRAVSADAQTVRPIAAEWLEGREIVRLFSAPLADLRRAFEPPQVATPDGPTPTYVPFSTPLPGQQPAPCGVPMPFVTPAPLAVTPTPTPASGTPAATQPPPPTPPPGTPLPSGGATPTSTPLPGEGVPATEPCGPGTPTPTANTGPAPTAPPVTP